MNFKQWLLSESKASIISFGFPEIIAKLFYQKFGNKAPLIAKWFKDITNYGKEDKWWNYYMDHGRPSLAELTTLYHASFSPEDYLKAIDSLDLSPETAPIDDDYLKTNRDLLKKQIEDKFFRGYFFNYSIIKDIMNGDLRDLSPYKSLPFKEALYKYEEKRIFNDITPVKTYRDGYKWINVGKTCPLVGSQLANCGSAGLMSMDKDSTMIVLFDSFNKAHIVVTYSPNENRISGDQGGASTAVKTKYHKYILDLATLLKANFDYTKSKSPLLRIKYRLKNKATGIQQIRKGLGDAIFRFIINGITYYSNEYAALPADDLKRVQQALKNGIIKLPIKSGSPISDLFNWRNTNILEEFGINYIPINNLV